MDILDVYTYATRTRELCLFEDTCCTLSTWEGPGRSKKGGGIWYDVFLRPFQRTRRNMFQG